jgi:hypothetical protein
MKLLPESQQIIFYGKIYLSYKAIAVKKPNLASSSYPIRETLSNVNI